MLGPTATSDAELRRAHAMLSYTTGRLQFAGLLGGATLRSGRWDDRSARPSIGARITGQLLEAGPVAIGASLQGTRNESRVNFSSFLSRAEWLEADAQLTASTEWRPTHATVVSPSLGVGYRRIDGNLLLSGTPLEPEFSADLVYDTLGLGIEWPLERGAIGLTAEGMLGDIEGFRLAMTARF